MHSNLAKITKLHYHGTNVSSTAQQIGVYISLLLSTVVRLWLNKNPAGLQLVERRDKLYA